MTEWLAQYVQVLEQLSPDNLDRLNAVTAEQIEFKDPFNHTTTRTELIALMADMFAKLNEVHFDVHQASGSGQQGMLYWTFSGHSKLTGRVEIKGMSQIVADQSGRVILHHDFWDGSEMMQKVPWLGALIGWLRSKFAHKPRLVK